MTDRIRPLTAAELRAISQAGELSQTLESLRWEHAGNQGDRECILDARSHLEHVKRCLDDLAKPDDLDD